MKNIERQLKENIEAVFDNRPDDGHRKRFAAKLAARRSRKTALLTVCFSAIAAAAVVAAIFVAVATDRQPDDETPVAEVCEYYAGLLDDEIDATKKMLSNVDETERQTLLDDLQQMQSAPVVPTRMTGEEQAAVIVAVYSHKIESLHLLQNTLQSVQ